VSDTGGGHDVIAIDEAKLRDLYQQDGNDFSEQADRDLVRDVIRELLWRRWCHCTVPPEDYLAMKAAMRLDPNHVDALPPVEP
jgi:hypothetical protein